MGLSREQQTHGAGAEGSGRGGGQHRNKGIGVEGVSGVLVWTVWCMRAHGGGGTALGSTDREDREERDGSEEVAKADHTLARAHTHIQRC